MSESIAHKLSLFKRDFLGAPVRKFFKAAIEGKEVDPVEVPYRKDEKYWLIQSGKNECQVYFGVNFQDETDRVLARIFMLELQTIQRKVQSCSGFHFADIDLPPELIKAFPHVGEEKYSNGIMSIKLIAKNNISRNFEQCLSFVIGFRQYVHYHLHAIKS